MYEHTDQRLFFSIFMILVGAYHVSYRRKLAQRLLKAPVVGLFASLFSERTLARIYAFMGSGILCIGFLYLIVTIIKWIKNGWE